MAENTATIWVRHLGGDRLGISVRGHELLADQPVGDGGEDSAPTPTELFLASLAGCVAFYAERFLRRHGLSTEGLVVACDYAWARDPARSERSTSGWRLRASLQTGTRLSRASSRPAPSTAPSAAARGALQNALSEDNERGLAWT